MYTLAGVDAVQVMDLDSRQLEAEIPVGASPHHPLSTPDGRLSMVVSQGPGTLDLFDLKTYSRTGVVPVGRMPHWIATSSDGRIAYVTNEGSNDVSVVDLATETAVAAIPVGRAPRKIVIQSGPNETPMTTSSAPAMSSPTPVAPPTSASVDGPSIRIEGFAFSPASVTVQAGQTLTFTNEDAVTHTATSAGGSWDSGLIAPGASYTLTLREPGTYTYHCSIHPFMQGTVIVTG